MDPTVIEPTVVTLQSGFKICVMLNEIKHLKHFFHETLFCVTEGYHNQGLHFWLVPTNETAVPFNLVKACPKGKICSEYLLCCLFAAMCLFIQHILV